MNYIPNISIKKWAEEDRPREKLARLGSHYVSDAELIAILLKTGNRQVSALDLAKQLLSNLDGDLHELAKCQLDDLVRFNGIGPAKAITIMAAMEIGRRRQLSNNKVKHLISSSRDAYDLIGPSIQDLPIEEFWVLFVNNSGRFICRECMSKGGINSTIVDSRVIFKRAIVLGASSIILAHNHPSGKASPSKQDILLTKNLVRAGKIVGIPVSDHLVIGAGDYYSFCDEGQLT